MSLGALIFLALLFAACYDVGRNIKNIKIDNQNNKEDK